MRVAISEFKSGLSRYLARARSGETIEVTAHGKPVALVVGIPAAGSPSIARLITSGAARWAGDKPELQPAVKLSPGGKPVGEAVIDDRG